MPLMALLEKHDSASLGELLWRISLPAMCAVLLLLAIPLGYVNPRVGRSANLIVALLLVVIYIAITNILQALVVQERSSFAMAWWPHHFVVIMLVITMFLWRLKVNSRWHPLILWSRCKSVFRSKEKCPA